MHKYDAIAETKESRDFRRYCSIYHLQPTDMGRKFRLGDNQYTIAGFLNRTRQKKILAVRSDGRKFKFSGAFVKGKLDGPARKEIPTAGGRILSLDQKNVLHDWLVENSQKVEEENPWMPSDWEDRLGEGMKSTCPCPFFNCGTRTRKKILQTSTLTFYLPDTRDLPI